ncbi:MAG TPA: hypothetical protein VFU69_03915 [Ktedonobacterales bacterium]|nr:hypothetical protein [Ktedonobacterales bacterium]
MSRKVLKAAKCSQMSNPTAGTGSGGDRCTEAVGAMIDATYKIGPWAKDGKHTVEQIMYQFTENLNHGSNTSAPENASWIGDWLKQNTGGKITLGDVQWPGFEQVVACIDQGHVAIGGFDDYVNLRLANGQNPYKWNDPHGLGHVLLIVGYDTDKHTVVVHDPLRADPGGQPADYSWAGFQAAKFHDLCEVHGPALPLAESSGAPQSGGQGNPAGGSDKVGIPEGWHDDGKTLTAPNGVAVILGFREWILAHAWDATDLPLAPEQQHLANIEYGDAEAGAGSRQDFRMSSLGWTPSKNVYKIWVGRDLQALQARIGQLQSELAKATTTPAVDLAALKADVATIQAALTPLEAQAQPLAAAEQAVQDIQKKLGS